MNDSPAFHILALSGGGYRGLYTATILAELEEHLGRPIASCFDLLCGTSIGGILALGLAAEIPAKNLRDLFIIEGKKIFKSQSLLRKLFGGPLVARHEPTGLKNVLCDHFGDSIIGDLKHRVIVPTVNYSTGLGQFFKTPHHESFLRDYKLPIIDVALATSAAPTFFPLFCNEQGIYADGGLIANAPGFLGLHEAQIFLSNPQNVRLLSVGTMDIGTSISCNKFLDRGWMIWRSKLFSLIISAQENSANFMLKHQLQDRYFRIDDAPNQNQCQAVKSLDTVSDEATQVLHDCGIAAAQRTLGDPLFKPFLEHRAVPPTFYHGSNKNC